MDERIGSARADVDLGRATVRELLIKLQQVEQERQRDDRFALRSYERAVRIELARRRERMAADAGGQPSDTSTDSAARRR